MIDRINELENNVDQLKTFLSRESGKRDRLLEEIKENQKKIEEADKKIDLLEKVNLVFKKSSEFARDQAKNQIENLVTNCLQFIFNSNIRFEIEISESYGKPNAEFYVITEFDDNTIKTKPEISRGGGIVDIVSLALRISFLQVHNPQIEGPLILDEPAKHVSEEYIYNVAEFLKETSKMFDRQIIMITHNNYLSEFADRAYRIELRGLESYITQIKQD